MSERWKPEDTYYFIDSIGMVGSLKWCDDSADKAYYKIGNCFRTREEAEAASENVKALLLGLHEPATECSRLPKLTTEVFNRPDCPKWAKYAAVNANGKVVLFSDIPNCRDNGWSVIWHSTSTQDDILDDVLFDFSDWQNSLIERPATLPDWCKVGAIVLKHEYMEIVEITDNGVKCKYLEATEDGTAGKTSVISTDYLITGYPARLRPYNADEMKALVGKSLKHSTGVYLVTAFEYKWDQVNIESVWRDSSELAELWTQLDDKPCGVLEHLNDEGEWVE